MKTQKIRKKNHDIFNGHIMDSSGFIAAFVLGYFLSVVVLICFFVTSGETFPDAKPVQTRFVSCSAEESPAVLVSDSGEQYKILHVPDEYDLSGLEAVCDGKTVLTVRAERSVPKEGEPYYRVLSVSNRGKDIVPESDILSFYKANAVIFLYIALGWFVLWSLFIALAVIAGRNPEKHRILVKIIFKPGYVIY